MPSPTAELMNWPCVSGKRAISHIQTILLSLATLTFLGISLIRIYQSPLLVWNGRRLATVIGAVRGLPIYFFQEGAGANAGTNGPFFILTYALSAFAPTPNSAIQVGVLCGLILFFSPVVLWTGAIKKGKWHLSSPALAICFTVFLMLRSRCLSLSSSIIHADAPALGFGLIAAAFAWTAAETKSSSRWFLAFLFCGAALFSKMTLAPLFGALTLFAMIRHGSKKGIFFSVIGLVAIGFLQIIFGIYFGMYPFFWSTWVSPFISPYVVTVGVEGNHTFSMMGRLYSVGLALKELGREYFPLIIPITLATYGEMKKKGWRDFFNCPWSLPLLFSFFLLLPSLMGRAKAGGAINTQSPCIYFLVIAASTLLWTWACSLKREQTSILVLMIFCSLFVVYQMRAIYFLLPYNSQVEENPNIISYEIAKKYKDEVYFPDYPLSTLYTDRRLYHSGVTIAELDANGYTIDKNLFHENLPVNLKYVAFTGEGYSAILDKLPEFTLKQTKAPFPGWIFYLKPSAKLSQ